MTQKKSKLFYQELIARGLIANVTDEEKFLKLLQYQGAIYFGIDPTASCLHLGHYLGLNICRLFQNFGCQIYFLIGGATAQIGDPSFRIESRPLLDQQTLKTNISNIKEYLKKYLAEAIIVDNITFYQKWNIFDFFNNVGNLINVNYLLNKESIKTRLNTGLTYTEFSYALLQGWDFYQLNQKYGILGQLGGSDQWGNITIGCEFIRKKTTIETNVCGITFPLLLNSQGKKFGKSAGNTLFLNPKLTKPFLVYQYLINISDEDVIKYLKLLTTIPLSEIAAITLKHQLNPKKRIAHDYLIKILLQDLYNDDENIYFTTFKWIFNNDQDHVFTSQQLEILQNSLDSLKLNSTTKLVQVLQDLKWASSAATAKRLINEQSITINHSLVTDVNYIFLIKKPIILRKGKKNLAFLY